jgi:hypothetical protein
MIEPTYPRSTILGDVGLLGDMRQHMLMTQDHHKPDLCFGHTTIHQIRRGYFLSKNISFCTLNTLNIRTICCYCEVSYDVELVLK